mgnify:CR=1 FL=1
MTKIKFIDARIADPRTVLQVEAADDADYQQLVSALAQAEAQISGAA